MRVSLILTSRGNKTTLKRFFDSINEQVTISSENFQIIFADQGCDEEFINQFRNRLYIDYIRISPTSLSSARNKVIKYIKGDIVGFPDDDCWYKSDFFSSLIGKFSHNANITMWICNIMDPENCRYYGNRPIIITTLDSNNIYHLPSSINMFLNTQIIEKNDIYFNEDMGIGSKWGSGEDVDLAFRIFKKYGNSFYDGTVSVFHPVILTGGNPGKAYSYGLGSGALAAKLLKANNYQHIWMFLHYIFRSLLGAIHSLLILKIKSFAYFKCRFFGLIIGFCGGYRYFKK